MQAQVRMLTGARENQEVELMEWRGRPQTVLRQLGWLSAITKDRQTSVKCLLKSNTFLQSA